MLVSLLHINLCIETHKSSNWSGFRLEQLKHRLQNKFCFCPSPSLTLVSARQLVSWLHSNWCFWSCIIPMKEQADNVLLFQTFLMWHTITFKAVLCQTCYLWALLQLDEIHALPKFHILVNLYWKHISKSISLPHQPDGYLMVARKLQRPSLFLLTRWASPSQTKRLTCLSADSALPWLASSAHSTAWILGLGFSAASFTTSAFVHLLTKLPCLPSQDHLSPPPCLFTCCCLGSSQSSVHPAAWPGSSAQPFPTTMPSACFRFNGFAFNN